MEEIKSQEMNIITPDSPEQYDNDCHDNDCHDEDCDYDEETFYFHPETLLDRD